MEKIKVGGSGGASIVVPFWHSQKYYDIFSEI